MNKTTELIDKIYKNSPINFVIGNRLLDHKVKIIKNKEDVPEQNEWEKECLSYLIKVFDHPDLMIYANITFGGYIITDKTFDLNVIALTSPDYLDQRHSVTRTTFTVNETIYCFDDYKGLSKVIWAPDNE